MIAEGDAVSHEGMAGRQLVIAAGGEVVRLLIADHEDDVAWRLARGTRGGRLSGRRLCRWPRGGTLGGLRRQGEARQAEAAQHGQAGLHAVRRLG